MILDWCALLRRPEQGHGHRPHSPLRIAVRTLQICRISIETPAEREAPQSGKIVHRFCNPKRPSIMPIQKLRNRSLVAIATTLCAAFTLALARAQTAPLLDLASFPRSDLTIAAKTGTHTFHIWLADTPDRQRQGLMFVRDLPADEGMLFVNTKPRVLTMWMKNTFIPLDMVFIDARGRIRSIVERTTPQSEAIISSQSAVKAVLELKGGEASRRGLHRGDRVQHAALRATISRQ